MKVETLNLGSCPFGISLIPETEGDKEILKKFFDNDIRITGYDTINNCMILEPKFKHRYVFTGADKISPEELVKEFGFANEEE